MTFTLICATCDYATEHGWWGPDHSGTHCSGCHRSWTGRREAHCAVCHQHFSADSVAVLHEPYCPDEDAMVAAITKKGQPVFDVRDRASGRVWVRHTSRPREWY